MSRAVLLFSLTCCYRSMPAATVSPVLHGHLLLQATACQLELGHPCNPTRDSSDSDLAVYGTLKIGSGLPTGLPAAQLSDKMPTLLQAIECCLDHPSLCRVLGKIAAPHALVLRLVHGQPLALKPDFSSLLRCRWPPGATFSESFVHRVACGCSAAMQSLTQLGVAHGDLYAHNLLADAEGEAVLCDYGEQADLSSV